MVKQKFLWGKWKFALKMCSDEFSLNLLWSRGRYIFILCFSSHCWGCL